MRMAFTRTTEVRKISSAELSKIAQILSQPSTSPAWRKLMQAIPSELTTHEHLGDEGRKYNSGHISLIEDAVKSQKRPAAQIFLDEWTTSGRIRPTLSHLLQLLVKSELFRAADYVAINLLSELPPQRPNNGPAAKIDIKLSQEDDSGSSRTINLNRDDSESHAMRSPLASLNLSKHLHSTTNDVPMTESTVLRSDQSENILPNFALINLHSNDSDAQHTGSNIPNLSILNAHTDSNIPNLSILNAASAAHQESNGNALQPTNLLGQSQSSSSTTEQQESLGYVPQISGLLGQSQSSSSILEQQVSFGNVPRIADLLGQSQSSSSIIEQQESLGYVPRIADLLGQSQSSSSAIELQESLGYVPRITGLLGQSQSTSSSIGQEQSLEYIPHMTELLNQSQSSADSVV